MPTFHTTWQATQPMSQQNRACIAFRDSAPTSSSNNNNNDDNNGDDDATIAVGGLASTSHESAHACEGMHTGVALGSLAALRHALEPRPSMSGDDGVFQSSSTCATAGMAATGPRTAYNGHVGDESMGPGAHVSSIMTSFRGRSCRHHAAAGAGRASLCRNARCAAVHCGLPPCTCMHQMTSSR